MREMWRTSEALASRRRPAPLARAQDRSPPSSPGGGGAASERRAAPARAAGPPRRRRPIGRRRRPATPSGWVGRRADRRRPRSRRRARAGRPRARARSTPRRGPRLLRVRPPSSARRRLWRRCSAIASAWARRRGSSGMNMWLGCGPEARASSAPGGPRPGGRRARWWWSWRRRRPAGAGCRRPPTPSARPRSTGRCRGRTPRCAPTRRRPPRSPAIAGSTPTRRRSSSAMPRAWSWSMAITIPPAPGWPRRTAGSRSWARREHVGQPLALQRQGGAQPLGRRRPGRGRPGSVARGVGAVGARPTPSRRRCAGSAPGARRRRRARASP